MVIVFENFPHPALLPGEEGEVNVSTNLTNQSLLVKHFFGIFFGFSKAAYAVLTIFLQKATQKGTQNPSILSFRASARNLSRHLADALSLIRPTDSSRSRGAEYDEAP
ncbi:MAG: hypothetical protein U5L07_02895 [Desulfobacterales bacterium]|nr:hypothetical protein [Desulfobacterales bacterium]